ncbi:MAG: PAS domain S-box protein [Candidatus Cloacimonetes bacterium]|nr:PAS domain S-box protein [Candidatus Cloacimonadota bacterium]
MSCFRIVVVQRIGLAAVLTFLLSLFFTTAYCVNDNSTEKQILLLDSYNPNYPTYDSHMAGLRSVLSRLPVEIDVEFMDTNRIHSEDSINNFTNYISKKLEHLPRYDLILASDDNAFNFVISHKYLFPKDIPIVFFGVNNQQLALNQNEDKQVTGVVEKISTERTFRLIKALQPDVKKTYLITDGTTTGKLDFDTICKKKKETGFKCETLSLEKMSWTDLQDSLRTLNKKDDSILLISALMDKNNHRMDFKAALKLISDSTKAPVYSLWEHGIGAGVVGGCVVSHFTQGKQAALFAEKLLKDNTLQIPVFDSESLNTYKVDYKEIKRKGLQARSLPSNTEFINKPDSIWQKYGVFFVLAFMLIIFQTILIASLFHALLQKKKYLFESKQNEEKLRITLQSIGDAVIATDTKGNITRMNMVAEKLTGWNSKDALGKNVKEIFRIVNAVTGEKLEDPVFKVLEIKGITGFSNNTKLFSRDNKEYLISDRAAPILNDEGNIVGVVMVFQDVTSQKKQAQIIKESEEQLNLFFNQSVTGFFLMKLDKPIDIRNQDVSELLPEIMKSLKVTKVNQALAEIYGLNAGSVIGKNVIGINTPGYDRLSIIKDIITEGSASLITVEKNANGQDIWVHGHYSALFEENGMLSGIFGTQNNVTDNYRKEIEIKALIELQKGILDNLVSSAVVKDVDDDFRILHWNKFIEEYSGIPAKEAIGKTDFELFPEEMAREIRESDIQVMKTLNHKITYEKKIVGKDGKSKYFRTVKTLIPKKDSSGLLISFSFDIDDLKNAQADLIIAKERAETADRLKSAFLANMSHEIRTPLNSIVGFSYLLAVSENEQESEEFYNIIKSNTDLLLTLINDIVDYSKIESGLLNLVHEKCDVNACLEKAANTVRPKIPESIEFKVIAPEAEPLYILIDVQRLLQILLNLLTNAMKHTEKGHIYLGYKIENDTIIFYVEDTGSGIEEADRDKIFERFFKKDPFKQGTGLGLSICKLLVEAFEGKIWMETEVGKGSTFFFSVPLHRTEMPQVEIEKPQRFFHVPLPPEMMNTILIAEDTMSNFLLLKTILSKSYNLIHATTGKQAIELYKKHKPDAILMDIKMPEMDGFEATKQIRMIDSDIPIIAVTAYAYDTDKILAMEAGCNNYVSKPIDVRILKSMLEKYL